MSLENLSHQYTCHDNMSFYSDQNIIDTSAMKETLQKGYFPPKA
jgi:hypothetical protein